MSEFNPSHLLYELVISIIEDKPDMRLTDPNLIFSFLLNFRSSPRTSIHIYQ